MRDQDLLGAPFIKLLGGGAAVGKTGEDLGFCRIGFEKIEIGEIGQLIFPVVEVHQAVFVVSEKSLNICGYLAFFGKCGDQLVGKIAVQQTGQMIQAAVHIGDLIGSDCIRLCQAFGLAAFAVGGEVGVLHQGGALGGQHGDMVAVQMKCIQYIGIVRMDLD